MNELSILQDMVKQRKQEIEMLNDLIHKIESKS